MIERMCAWPRCEAGPSIEIDVPLCGPHAARVYRRVAEAMRAVETPRLRADMGARPSPTRARRNTKDTPGVVYFARFGELVKIGFTTNLRQRMAAIRPDELLATTPGTMRDEEAMHHRFGDAWSRGELFRPTGRLMSFIDTLRDA